MAHEGASNNERLLAAAKSDNEELLMEIFNKPDSFDINHKDGLGNTALHYAVKYHSYDVLEHLLCYDGCDVDPINRLEGASPLHLAVKIEDPEIRFDFVESLLEAGADRAVTDKNGDKPLDLVGENSEDIRSLFRKAEADRNIDRDDIANDDDYDVVDDSD